jgi:hypothetical protein
MGAKYHNFNALRRFSMVKLACMKTGRTFLKVLSFLLLAATAGSASTVQLAITAIPSVNENGENVGYAPATVNGISISLMCDDADSTTYAPSGPMIYDFSTLTGSTPLQYARFAQPIAPSTTPSAEEIQLYDEAAVVLWQFSQQHSPSNDTVTAYQYALWNLMNPGVTLYSPLKTQEQQIQNTAYTYVTTSANADFLATDVYPNLQIYTPTAAYSSNQEFLNYSTPEPGMLPVLGLALVGIGMWKRPTRQRASEV